MIVDVWQHLSCYSCLSVFVMLSVSVAYSSSSGHQEPGHTEGLSTYQGPRKRSQGTITFQLSLICEALLHCRPSLRLCILCKSSVYTCSVCRCIN